MTTFRIDPGAGNVTTALANALEAAKRGDVIFVPTDAWHKLACRAATRMQVAGVTIRIAGEEKAQ